MNAKNLLLVTLMLALFLSACASSATEAPREEPVIEQPAADVPVVVEVEKEGVAEESDVEYISPQPTSPGSIAQQPMPTPLPTMTAPQEGEVAPPQPPDAMFFENYGVNPFVDTYEDHLSTFALDVDTASYSVARRYVEDGNVPPAVKLVVHIYHIMPSLWSC